VAWDGDDARSGACVRLAWYRYDAGPRLDSAAAQRLAWHGDDGAPSRDASALRPRLARHHAASGDDSGSCDDDAASSGRWMARPDRGRPDSAASGWWHGPASGERFAAGGW
jgi:hypothetical protein